MSSKAVLLDLENNMPTASLLREIIEHYPVLYLLNCKGYFEYSLEDLTEFSSWVSSGKIIILDTPSAAQKEFEYAVVVGQLMALLESDSHVEIISAMDSSEMLLDMLSNADISCSLIQIQEEVVEDNSQQHHLPSVSTIKAKPHLQLVKKYCDALGKMTGKPNTVEALRNSVENILQVLPEKAQHLVGMLINLKIVKRYDEQVNFRKKILKQWLKLDLEQTESVAPVTNLSDAMAQLNKPTGEEQSVGNSDIQVLDLYRNFAQVDPVQLEVIKKLNLLNAQKPKDIYALRDVLSEMFPQSDIRLLLKELLDKGYIYWNGHEVIYSHEMFLN